MNSSRRRWLGRAGLRLALLTGVVRVASAEETPSASAVKAAYLYKLLNYVELPAGALAQPDTPLVIGVAGADDVHAEMVQVLRERSPGGRPVQLRRLGEGDSPAGLHVLFAGTGIDPLRSALVKAARERPLLLVTDAPTGLKAGASINFVIVRSRVRFEVSLDAAERSSIKISSRVLALAERVIGAH